MAKRVQKATAKKAVKKAGKAAVKKVPEGRAKAKVPDLRSFGGVGGTRPKRAAEVSFSPGSPVRGREKVAPDAGAKAVEGGKAVRPKRLRAAAGTKDKGRVKKPVEAPPDAGKVAAGKAVKTAKGKAPGGKGAGAAKGSSAGRKAASKTKSAAGSGISELLKKYMGSGFPRTIEGVRNFLVDAGVVREASEVPRSLAQRISFKMHAIPAAKVEEGLRGVVTGLRDKVGGLPEGASVARALAEWFEVSDTPLRNTAAKVVAGGRKFLRSWPGAGAALGAAYLGRSLLDAKAESNELAAAERMQPSAEDLFSARMLDELRTRSRIRTLSGAGKAMTSRQLAELALGAEEEGPLDAVSLPPSEGFPVR